MLKVDVFSQVGINLHKIFDVPQLQSKAVSLWKPFHVKMATEIMAIMIQEDYDTTNQKQW